MHECEAEARQLSGREDASRKGSKIRRIQEVEEEETYTG